MSENKVNSKLSILRHVIQNELQYSFSKGIIRYFNFFLWIYRIIFLMLYYHFGLIFQCLSFFASERKIQISKQVIQNIISKWQEGKKNKKKKHQQFWLLTGSLLDKCPITYSCPWEETQQSPLPLQNPQASSFHVLHLILEAWWQIIRTSLSYLQVFCTVLHLPVALIFYQPSIYLFIGK